jgi:23S rRNA (uracil-5-)-methyltransferase RumA
MFKSNNYCQHYGTCGGCSLRHLPYKDQLAQKQKALEELLADLPKIKLKPILPSKHQNFYRNKMDFAFGKNGAGFALGLREKNRFDRVVDIKKCLLFSELGNDIMDCVRTYCTLNNIASYDLIKHTGILRYLVMRQGKYTGDFMVNLVSAPAEESVIAGVADAVSVRCKGVSTFLWSVSDRLSDDSQAHIQKVFWGDGFISEKLNGIIFKISPHSFFQTNSYAAETLYAHIKKKIKMISHKRTARLFDLYCGTGGIGISAARSVKAVFGIEYDFNALMDAVQNASDNGIKHFYPLNAKAEKMISPIQFKKTDVIIIDPPRAGVNQKAARKICESNIQNLIYVSCNPKTFKLDLDMLTRHFRVIEIQPFDLFPHTPHVECVAVLRRVIS